MGKKKSNVRSSSASASSAAGSSSIQSLGGTVPTRGMTSSNAFTLSHAATSGPTAVLRSNNNSNNTTTAPPSMTMSVPPGVNPQLWIQNLVSQAQAGNIPRELEQMCAMALAASGQLPPSAASSLPPGYDYNPSLSVNVATSPGATAAATAVLDTSNNNNNNNNSRPLITVVGAGEITEEGGKSITTPYVIPNSNNGTSMLGGMDTTSAEMGTLMTSTAEMKGDGGSGSSTNDGYVDYVDDDDDNNDDEYDDDDDDEYDEYDGHDDDDNYNNDNDNDDGTSSNDAEELRTLLPLFTELVSLTNTIVSAQESGDAARVDAATSRLCERVMRDERAIGILGEAIGSEVKVNSSPNGVISTDAILNGLNGAINARNIVANLSATQQQHGGGGGMTRSGMIGNDARRQLGGGDAGIGMGMNAILDSMNFLQTVNAGANDNRMVHNMSKEELEARVLSIQAAQAEVMQKMTAMGMPQAWQQQQQYDPNMIFGGAVNVNPGGSGTTPYIPPWGPTVPLIPPPVGGWPPTSSFAMGSNCATTTQSTSSLPIPPYTPNDYYGSSRTNCTGDISNHGTAGGTAANSAAWLDYYDACLRARGVKGGLAEFEEFALLSGGPDLNFPNLYHRGVPQDRSIVASVEFVPSNMDKDNLAVEAEKEEERLKKAAKKRDKKARQKERAKKEAEIKAAEAAMKKRDKTVTSWRSRIVTACLGGDAKKMDALLAESPFKNYVYDPTPLPTLDRDDDDEDGGDCNYDDVDDGRPKSQEEYLLLHMDWFLSNCIQKYPTRSSSELQPFANNVLAREKLTKYILSVSFESVLVQSPLTHNRNAIHSAAYRNDANFIKWIIDCQKNISLDMLCEDGGWAPLHYATAGGAIEVVELLLQEGVSVSTRTDPSLSHFTRRPGVGITVRELAIVLQSGDFDDDLTSTSVILDDVENRIEHASSHDKSDFKGILASLVQRFSDIENRGYTPPPVQDERMSDNSVADADNKDVGRHISSTVTSTVKAKKKKKKQQQESVVTATSSLSEIRSTNSALDDEDLTDPVAVALLGMGFTEDQIRSAARALGGFSRATADDMVMWILGGGEIVDSGRVANTSHNLSSKKAVQKAEGAIVGKAQKKAAARAKDSEEAARKRQEELTVSKRAAEKKEEQRRIRREWNEREQARHELEKNAKMMAALERRKQAEMEKLMPKTSILPTEMPPGVGLPSTGVLGGGKHHNSGGHGPPGLPMTIIAGGPKTSAKAKGGSNMGIPQAPTIRAPKILTRPSTIPPGMSGATGSVHSQGPGSQPLFASAPSSTLLPASSLPRNIQAGKTFTPSSSQVPLVIHQRQKPPTTILQKPASAGGTRNNNRGQNVSATAESAPLFQNPRFDVSASVAPPGFFSGNVLPSQQSSATDSTSSNYAEVNSLGMIRATAREFVPTSFKPTAASMSAQSMQSTIDMVPAAPTTQSVSNNHSDIFGDDRNPPITLVGKGDSTVPSAASSITGVSGLQTTSEEKASQVGSIMTFESTSSNAGIGGGIQTSSILESISYDVGRNSPAPLVSGGIWGGGNTVNQPTSLGLALNFGSFLGNVDSNSNNGNNVSGGSTWGSNTGRGSIW